MATDALAATDPAVLCFIGPAGIGKTRLVRVLTERARGDNYFVAWSRCWNGPGTPALWPWVQLLDYLSGGDEHPLSNPGSAGVDGRFSQFESVAAYLSKVRDHQSLLLVIDDIHWADPASLQLIHFLSRDTRNPRLNLVVTYRAIEATTGPHFETIANIEREATVIHVEGMIRAEVEALVLAEGEASAAMIEALYAQSEGNPFFVLELARVLRREGHLHGSVPDHLPVTSGVRAAVENHLALVSQPTRDALALAAIQGLVFETTVLSAAAQLDEIEVAEMLHEAVSAGLVLQGEGVSRQFEHALIGETLLVARSPHELARDHLATADGIDKVHGPAQSGQLYSLANHLLAAGSLVPANRLLHAALSAADHSHSRLAWENESHHLATAIHALHSHPESDTRALVDLLVRPMNVEKELRDLTRAHVLGLEAAALARQAGDHIALAEVALAFPPDSEGIEIDDIFDPDQRPLREEALAGLGDGSPNLRSRLQAALALSLYWETPTGDRAESHQLSAARREELTASALAAAREFGDPETLAIALNARICANWGPSMKTERPALAEELIAVARGLEDHDMALRGRVWRVTELMEQGRLAEADREIDAFEREAARIHSRLHLWTAARWRANRAFMDGDLVGAEGLAAAALELGTEIMDPEVAFHFYTTSIGPLQYLRCTLGESLDYIAGAAA